MISTEEIDRHHHKRGVVQGEELVALTLENLTKSGASRREFINIGGEKK